MQIFHLSKNCFQVLDHLAIIMVFTEVHIKSTTNLKGLLDVMEYICFVTVLEFFLEQKFLMDIGFMNFCVKEH